MKFNFSKEFRLLTSRGFVFVFQKPQYFNIAQITIFSRLNSLKHPRIGLIVAKKNVKYAHERNRIKRLIRESFRLRQHKLPFMDFIIVVEKGIDEVKNITLLEILEKLWCHYYPLTCES